jgi:MFS family permease
VAVFLVVSVGYATSHQITRLLSWRLLQGIGSGTLLVAVRSYVSVRAGSEARGTANALVTSASNGGELLGPAIGGLLADAYSYRVPFVVLSICIAALLPCLAFLPRETQQAGDQTDVAPIKSPHPLFKASNKLLPLLSAVRFAEMAGFAVWLTVWAPYANGVMKWDATRIGLTFSVAAAAGLITGPAWGMASDRVGRAPVLATGLFLVLVQVIIVLLFPSWSFIWIAFFLGGAGGTGYFDAMFAVAGDATEGEGNTGRAIGVIGSVGEVGSAVGPWAASAIWRLSDIGMSFVLNIALLLVALALVLCLPRPMTVMPGVQKGSEV